MKIIQVVHSLPDYSKAGTEIYTYQLLKELSNRHEVYCFYRISNIKMKEYAMTRKRLDGFISIAINNTFKDCYSFQDFYKNEQITKKFSEVLDFVKPDIVHIQHLIFLSTGIIEEASKRGIPIIYTLHDYWLICPQWHFLKHGQTICDGLDLSECEACVIEQLNINKSAKNFYRLFSNFLPGRFVSYLKKVYLSTVKVLPKKRSQLLNLIETRKEHMDRMIARIDRFIAPSEFIKNKYISFGVPEENINLLRSGVDNSLFNNVRKNGSNKIRFGFIGTILPAKGLDVLINAFNNIKDQNAELNIYGKLYPYNGFENYPYYIKGLVKNKNIRFRGEFSRDGIANILSEIDILVVPSIWFENTPLVILEALAAGVPVIASNIGGVPEIIKDNINGFLFIPGEVNELYKILAKIVNEPAIIRELADNIDDIKDVRVLCSEIKELYDKVLNKKKDYGNTTLFFNNSK